MRRALFIINPKAGRGAALRVWKTIESLVASDRSYEAVIPSSAAETRRLALEAARAGVERVVVLGGDGTMDIVAGALAGTDTIMGMIPSGTGNDMCKTNAIPCDPEAALPIAIGPHTRQVDLGLADGRHPFLNVAGVGFDAEVAAVHRNYPKGLGGTLPFLLGTLATLRRYKPAEVTIMVDDQRYVGPITLAAVANGPQYGGGMRIAPGASRDDGLFDVYVAEAMSPWEMLALLPRVYTGTYVRHPKVHLLRGSHVRIEPESKLYAHVDGDVIGGTAWSFQVQPRALTVAVPPEAGGEVRTPAPAVQAASRRQL